MCVSLNKILPNVVHLLFKLRVINIRMIPLENGYYALVMKIEHILCISLTPMYRLSKIYIYIYIYLLN